MFIFHLLGLNGSLKKSSSTVNGNCNSNKSAAPAGGGGAGVQTANSAISLSTAASNANTNQLIGIKEIKSRQRVSYDCFVYRQASN